MKPPTFRRRQAFHTPVAAWFRSYTLRKAGVRSVGTSEHPIINTFEPGERWSFDYEKRETVKGMELPPPQLTGNRS